MGFLRNYTQIKVNVDVFVLLSLFPLSLFLQEYCVPFMETSAKTGVNVEMAFISVAKCVLPKHSDNN